MKFKNYFILLLCFTCILSVTNAQLLITKNIFTHADTLRGSNGPGRDWWDVLKYDLHVKFNLVDSTLSGYNIIQLKVLKQGEAMQIDLQEPMILDSVFYSRKFENGTIPTTISNFKKEGNAYFFKFNQDEQIKITNLTVYYHGKPRIAVNPPWDGGLIWKKDQHNNPWVSIACQGLGASVWYPCKDIQSDEPDSAEMHITCPDTLMCVGNGRYRGKIENGDGTATYDWAVVNPINNYCLIPYIGKYVHFGEIFKGEKGDLSMDYWVLDYNLEKAKKQFTDAPRMMKAFEYWFGPYPFYEDGYKLVDAPHLGMEHQSAVAYGNGYQKGYYGQDRSGTGIGLQWDFIIVHESGHEWFANNITTKDIADMWVHEAFTTYSEILFAQYYYGKKTAETYMQGVRKNIKNLSPIIGAYGVNNEGSGDMYEKGASMIHAIRQIINNDVLFRQILRGLNKDFYHQTVTTKQIENYISSKSNIDFSTIFDQYLRTIKLPVLEFKQGKNKVQYRYTNCIKDFKMPLKLGNNYNRWIKPASAWQTINLPAAAVANFSIDPNFYIITKKVD